MIFLIAVVEIAAASLAWGQSRYYPGRPDTTLLDRRRWILHPVSGAPVEVLEGMPADDAQRDYFTLLSTKSPARRRKVNAGGLAYGEFLRASTLASDTTSDSTKPVGDASPYIGLTLGAGVSTATNRATNPQTSLTNGPVIVNTNGPGNNWSNAIIVDLPPPGTVVNLSGAFLPPGLTNIVAISAGKSHALAVREDRSVAAWGNQVAHRLGVTNVPSYLTNVVAVCAGDDYSLALQLDGTVASWGSGVCASLPALNSVVALAGGPQHCVALRFDGTVVSWGPRASLPAGLTDVKAIAAGEFHTVIARRDGTVQVFGSPNADTAGAPTNAVSVMVDFSFYALTAEKTLVSFGPNPDTVPAALSEVIAFSARDGRCLALQGDGTVVGWGNVTVPASVKNVSAVAAGALYCLVLTTNPPTPTLAVSVAGSSIHLSSPLAVSGYRLLSREDIAAPWTEFNVSANALDWEEADYPFLTLPATDPKRFFRLKRIQP